MRYDGYQGDSGFWLLFWIALGAGWLVYNLFYLPWKEERRQDRFCRQMGISRKE